MSDQFELASLLFGKGGGGSDKQETIRYTYGTAVGDSSNGSLTVRLDNGDEAEYPCYPHVKNGQRVMISIRGSKAVVLGCAGSEDALSQRIGAIEADYVKANVIEAQIAYINTLMAGKVTAESIAAANAYIETLTAEGITAESIKAANAYIADLTADEVTAEKLKAANAYIETLTSKTVTADSLAASSAYIARLLAGEVSADNLIADHAAIESLDTKFANIDFANVGIANIGEFFAKSGILDNIVVGNQTITGKLVGVTITGDLIEANTVVADKLVILGEDGLYYKLNASGETVEAEQTDYNSIDGSHIKAQSITASKVSVDDLVAFSATIGGSVIEDGSVHTYGKNSVDNTTAGFYFDDSGRFVVGNGSNYLKFKDGKMEAVVDSVSIDGAGLIKMTESAGTRYMKIQSDNVSVSGTTETLMESDSGEVTFAGDVYRLVNRIRAISSLTNGNQAEISSEMTTNGRTYSSKVMTSESNVYIGSTGSGQGNVTIESDDVVDITAEALRIIADLIDLSSIRTPSIELNMGGDLTDSGGFVDFHFGGGTTDFTSRIIESSSGVIEVNADKTVKLGETYIEDNIVADHVVAQNITSNSAAGQWSWRKWASGKAECWVMGYLLTTDGQWTLTRGMYISNNSVSYTCPFAFTDEAKEFAVLRAEAGYPGFIQRKSSLSTTKTATYGVALAQAVSGWDMGHKFYIYRVGRWK